MPLIDCPECGESVSDLAESCPHCGYQPRSEDLSTPKAEERRVILTDIDVDLGTWIELLLKLFLAALPLALLAVLLYAALTSFLLGV